MMNPPRNHAATSQLRHIIDQYGFHGLPSHHSLALGGVKETFLVGQPRHVYIHFCRHNSLIVRSSKIYRSVFGGTGQEVTLGDGGRVPRRLDAVVVEFQLGERKQK